MSHLRVDPLPVVVVDELREVAGCLLLAANLLGHHLRRQAHQAVKRRGGGEKLGVGAVKGCLQGVQGGLHALRIGQGLRAEVAVPAMLSGQASVLDMAGCIASSNPLRSVIARFELPCLGRVHACSPDCVHQS